MSNPTKPGLYERVIDHALAQRLSASPLVSERAPLNPGESARRLTQALQAYLLRALEDVPTDDRPQVQVALCNQIIRTLAERLPDFSEEADQLTSELLTREAPTPPPRPHHRGSTQAARGRHSTARRRHVPPVGAWSGRPRSPGSRSRAARTACSPGPPRDHRARRT